jgi:hypothetical protein
LNAHKNHNIVDYLSIDFVVYIVIMSKIPEMSREHLAGNREFAAERMKVVHRLETIIRIHRTACLHAHTCFNNNDISAGDFQRFETHYEEALDRLRNVDKNQCCKCERWSDETSEQDGRMICHGCFQDEKYEEAEKTPSIEKIEEIFGPSRSDVRHSVSRRSTPSIEDFEQIFGPSRSDVRHSVVRRSTPSIEDFEQIFGPSRSDVRHLNRLRNVDKNQCCKCKRWSDETSEQDGRMICHGCFQDEKYEEEEKTPSIEEIEEIFGPNRPDFHRPPPRHSTPSIEDFEAAFGPNRSDFRRPLPRHSTPSIEDFEAISGSHKTGFRPDIPTENRGSNLADPILIDSD